MPALWNQLGVLAVLGVGDHVTFWWEGGILSQTRSCRLLRVTFRWGSLHLSRLWSVACQRKSLGLMGCYSRHRTGDEPERPAPRPLRGLRSVWAARRAEDRGGTSAFPGFATPMQSCVPISSEHLRFLPALGLRKC